MSILRELLPGQHIRIDNHERGVPMRWDWEPGERPEDIHLDKTMNRRVKGKEVQVRVTLNKDGGVKEPHQRYRNDHAWMDEYNRVKDEVRDVLEKDADLTKDFVKSVKDAIQTIGPHKERRAVRMALERIGEFFGLDSSIIEKMTVEAKGLCCFCLLPRRQQQFYIAFDDDFAFYLGEGNERDFRRHSRVTWLWRQMCSDLGRCPTLQDLVNYYMGGEGRKTRKGMEDELNFVATVLGSEGVTEGKKAETLLVPESHEKCPVRRTHLWRMLLHEAEKDGVIHAIVRNDMMNRVYSSFDDAMACVGSVLLPFRMVGGLAVYDIAKRIWWAQGHRSLQTDYVVLAQGAYEGAKCVLAKNLDLNYKTDKGIFPPELNNLDALYVEDFLCVLKKELALLYNV